ncbi:MAG: hypothetical protein R3B13_17600 [Polyangiaceae bacterium]
MTRSWLTALSLAVALGACGDPVKDKAIESLGPEAPGVEPGPLHRPGQPCLYCHDGYGEGGIEFSVAGTVFAYAESPQPLANALVHVIDSKGHRASAGTNCAGNFFFQRADYDPTFPIWTTLQFGSELVEMSTPIFRNGSCAQCHRNPLGPSNVGQVFFAPPGFPLQGGSCQ